MLSRTQGNFCAHTEASSFPDKLSTATLTCANSAINTENRGHTTDSGQRCQTELALCPVCGFAPLEPVRCEGITACAACTDTCTDCGDACLPGEDICCACDLAAGPPLAVTA